MAAGLLVAWLGYGLGSYGYVLVRGWNIPARQWFNPLDPYQWPAKGGTVPTVPAGQTFPGKAATSATTASAQTTPTQAPNTGNQPSGGLAGSNQQVA
jgi:hypothetical protein